MDNSPMQATPYRKLIDKILNSSVPKNEREHAACREIETLTKERDDLHVTLINCVVLIKGYAEVASQLDYPLLAKDMENSIESIPKSAHIDTAIIKAAEGWVKTLWMGHIKEGKEMSSEEFKHDLIAAVRAKQETMK